MKNYLILISLLFLVAHSCTPPVVFEEAYPIDAQDLSTIPSEYQDVFLCESDSALVIINDNEILIREEHYFKTHIDRIEEREDCSIVGDEMYIQYSQECVPIEYINDSIVQGIMVTWDTLFAMGPSSIARSYKGHLILSTQMYPDQWAVSLLSLNQDQSNITYRAITDKTKLKEVKKITPMSPINEDKKKRPQHIVKPTMAEFDKLLSNEKVFIECEYLIRVNLEGKYIFLN